MPEVIIMRGPAGCGKSTWIKKNCPDAVVVSADHFWIVQHEDGTEEYLFDISRLAEAHQDCLCRFVDSIVAGYQQIVVDNTNICRWQYAAYEKIARSHQYEVRIVEFRPVSIDDIKTCIKRNVHRVPAQVVTQMCTDFEAEGSAQEILKISS